MLEGGSVTFDRLGEFRSRVTAEDNPKLPNYRHIKFITGKVVREQLNEHQQHLFPLKEGILKTISDMRVRRLREALRQELPPETPKPAPLDDKITFDK